MFLKKSFSSTFARIAFSLFLTNAAFAGPSDISFEISKDGKSIMYSHDHLENYEFQSIVEALLGKDISWSLLNALDGHPCTGLEDTANMYVQHGISYTYDSKLVHDSLPKTRGYQKLNNAPKLVKAVFNPENESFDLTYQYYYNIYGFRGYYDFNLRVKFLSLSDIQQSYFDQLKNMANVGQNNIVVETKKEKAEVDFMLIPGMNVSQIGKILDSISYLEQKLHSLNQDVELKENSEEALANVFIALKSLQGILSEEVQLSSLNDIIELTSDLVFNLETLLFSNDLIEVDWYLFVLKTNNGLVAKFKKMQDDDAKKNQVMRSLQGALESLADRLDIVARVIARYQLEDLSDSKEEEVTIVEEEVVIAEKSENNSDNIIIIPPIAPPAPEMLPVQSSNVSEQRGDLLAQIRGPRNLKKTVHQKKEITPDLINILRAALEKRDTVLNTNVDEKQEEESWSSDEE